ncbi:hypothetical protein [Prauserella endophytica]|uniref:hypothetical protein n=1 Tax=Prauserella endophytica TaxID=1592324 RepID=UPI0013051EE4|nr:hypothetical protein [Prauserella endophytica]
MCRDGLTCPSVWASDDDPDHVVIVGHPVEVGTVPAADDEIAVRVKRQVIAAARIE